MLQERRRPDAVHAVGRTTRLPSVTRPLRRHQETVDVTTTAAAVVIVIHQHHTDTVLVTSGCHTDIARRRGRYRQLQ